MKKAIQDLVDISQKFGRDKNYTIAGGGNTSYKTRKELWVKASGYGLATISEEGFVNMDRDKLNLVSKKTYSKDPFMREQEVKEDMEKACKEKGKRPSVEASLHNAIDFAYVVHMHPFLINAVLCSVNAEETVNELWGDQVVFVPYTDPGYVLFKEVESKIGHFRNLMGEDPKIIMMQNHGIFVSADTVDEIDDLYNKIMNDILNAIPYDSGLPTFHEISFDADKELDIPFEFLKSEGLLIKSRNNELISSFSKNYTAFKKVQVPFTPDVIVYCKSEYMYIQEDIQNDLGKLQKAIRDFNSDKGFFPKVLIVEGKGMVAITGSHKEVSNVLDVFEDQMKIAWYSEFFGGPHPMESHQIKFIDTWEVENYRRKVSQKP